MEEHSTSSDDLRSESVNYPLQEAFVRFRKGDYDADLDGMSY